MSISKNIFDLLFVSFEANMKYPVEFYSLKQNLEKKMRKIFY